MHFLYWVPSFNRKLSPTRYYLKHEQNEHIILYCSKYQMHKSNIQNSMHPHNLYYFQLLHQLRQNLNFMRSYNLTIKFSISLSKKMHISMISTKKQKSVTEFDDTNLDHVVQANNIRMIDLLQNYNFRL